MKNENGVEEKTPSKKERIRILYEDSALCVIYKAEGILSVSYPGSASRTAESLLEEILRKKGTYSKKHRPFAVHRLDRDTSGVMMFAMTEQAQKKIMDGWHKIVLERVYRAVAENPSDASRTITDSGVIEDEIAYNSQNLGFVPEKNTKSAPEKHAGSSASMRAGAEKHGGSGFNTVRARTEYRVLCRGRFFTLFELSLDTGRKNQIRVHLASRGYPLAGDKTYRAESDPFGRLSLHARTLAFVHPYTGEKMRFDVPEPENWLEFVKEGAGKGRRNVNDPRKTVRSSKKRSSENQASVPRKKTRGMDFISRGKLRGGR